MIEFITEGNGGRLTFNDVEDNQFFVDIDGNLCHRIDEDTYSLIADNTGNPHGGYFDDVLEDSPIKKVLPKVVKINFG